VLRRNLKKAMIGASRQQGRLSGPAIDEPEELRFNFHKAMLMLSEQEQGLMRDRLMSGLAQSGLHIGAFLFLLGIPARTPDEILPNDLAKLIRFVQINHPEAIREIAAPLAALQARPFHAGNSVKAARKAA
jgi:hypothetical protein